jgi:hypothetical protein
VVWEIWLILWELQKLVVVWEIWFCESYRNWLWCGKFDFVRVTESGCDLGNLVDFVSVVWLVTEKVNLWHHTSYLTYSHVHNKKSVVCVAPWNIVIVLSAAFPSSWEFRH